MTRHYYAAKSPRGFSNEIDIFRFDNKPDRDAFVDCGDLGAYAITAREAHKILARKDNALTQQYNRLLEWDAGNGEWQWCETP